MEFPYIPEFADFMSTGHYATTSDLISHLIAVNAATTTHIASLQSGANPDYPPNHPDFFQLAAILHKANSDSYHLLAKIEAEISRYHENMQLLYQEWVIKYLSLLYKYGGHAEAQERLGEDVLDSAHALIELTEDLNLEPQDVRKGYLTEIWRFWRRYTAREEWQPYEDVWRVVAERALPRME